MSSTKDFYVVGIGASAGGLEAIESFFTKVPSNSGLAYVIIQHLSPDYKSLMPEILSKRTSLPVHTAEDGMFVEPDNIYLIPRKVNMKIFHSRLHLTEKSTSQMLNLPIDIFFQSLAEDFEDKAIAVVLSGTGSDGSRGIRMVKENGGIVIVQDLDSSKFDGMPKSAVQTGTVDFILPPQEMPGKIISYVQHPYILEKDKNSELSLVPGDDMTKIILILKDAFGLDFTYYKDTTISRRIERRLSINQIENLKDYLEFLTVSKNEQSTLYKELLIGVTKFFRDSEAFQYIENEIIPEIFKNKTPGDEIRVWISACSTGEEAYSVAILFKEYMISNNLKNEIKIFATDIDKTAVENASYGVYNSSITADVSTERLKKFFSPHGDNYRINENIREMIVFATQNVIKDPPFNKIDFLTCRNLLIYFQSPLQQKVISVFNFALKKNGYMFLGSSETIGEMETYFEITSHKFKVYKSIRNAKLTGNSISNYPGGIIQNVPIKKPVFTLKNSVNDLVNIFTEKILIDNAPITVVVNEFYEIVNSFGDLNKYLVLPNINKISEGFQFNIANMVPANLKLTFSIAINKAIKLQEDVIHYNIKYQTNEKEFSIVDIVFSPLNRPDLNSKFVVIYFNKKETNSIVKQEIQSFTNVDQLVQQRILDLENELKHSRENLQAGIEELETTNEELQSTNEELISSNEELQSTNEELQSVNEELYTVNTEFQLKNHELVVMNNDMENLLQNSEVRIIFLDIDLRIRKFTQNISDIFNLKSNDQGRPISDITHNIKNVNLSEEIQLILKEFNEIHKTVQAKDKWYRMSILPYLTRKGFMEGVVLSYVDITDYHNIQGVLKEGQRIAQLGNWVLNHLTNELYWSEEIYRIFDCNQNEFDATFDGFIQQIHPDDRELVSNSFFNSIKNKTAYEIEHRVLNKNKTIKYVREKCTTEFDSKGSPLKSFGIVIDITKQTLARNSLQRSEEQFKGAFESAANGMVIAGLDGKFISVNQAFCNLLGYTKSELFELDIMKITYSEDLERDSKLFQQLLKDEIQSFRTEKRYVHKTGQIVWTLLNVTAVKENYKTIHFIGQILDITDKKNNEIIQDIINKKQDVINTLNETAILHQTDLKSFSDLTLKLLTDFLQCKDGYLAAEINSEIIKISRTNGFGICEKNNNCNILINQKSLHPCFCNAAYSQENGFYTNKPSEFVKNRNLKNNTTEWSNYLSVPVISDNLILGQIVMADKINDFTEDDFQFVNQIAAKYAMLILRLRSKQQLLQANQMYWSIFENMNNGFALHQIIFDNGKIADSNFLNVNKSFEKITGISKDTILGKTMKQINPQFGEGLITIFSNIYKTGETFIFEYESKLLNKKFKVNAFSPEKNIFVTLFEEN